MNPVILYHGNCPDGTGSALAAYFKFGEDASYVAVSYGQSMPELPDGCPVYILDFSYPREVLESLKQSHPDLVVLDHHATAQKDLIGLSYAKFDMNKSGSVLSWEHFSAEAVPEFFLYLQDRDLWKFLLPMSREVSMALRSYPMDFRFWFHLWQDVEKLKEEGDTCR